MTYLLMAVGLLGIVAPATAGITGITKVGDTVSLSWEAFGDITYTVKWTNDPLSGIWQSPPGTWPITETTWSGITSSDVIQRFYRVESGGVCTDPPVGFVKVEAVRDGVTMVSVPLQAADNNLNGEPGCIGDMIKENLTGRPVDSDTIRKWDESTQTWEEAFLIAGWGAPYDGKWWDLQSGDFSTMTIDACESFYILRRNTGDSIETVTILGTWVSCPVALFVDAAASGANDGSSWADAYLYLQDALTDAAVSGKDIFVAEGTYKPDQGGVQTLGDRTATFQLINGVEIYGGFPSGGGTWEQRDPIAYETILSGDLAGDDDGFTNNDENSYHVVIGSGTGATAVLDGFTITGGNADGSPPAHNGGGMYNDDGSPTVSNCIYSGNSAQSVGGGMYNNDSSPTLIKCVFSENSSDAGGGMLNDFDCRPILINCAFIGNSAIDGGGMLNFDFVIIGQNRPTLTNCIFSGNSAVGYGGGMCNGWSEPKLTNCTFSGNSAGSSGGGMSNDGSNPALNNCILWGNSDSGGYDESAQIFDFNSTPIINYSCVQGWTGSLGGAGNIGNDPMFKDADGPDNIIGTEDDNLELAAGSPCIDAGDNNSVPADMADLDGDGDTSEPTPFDLEGNPRLFDDPITADTGYPPWADAIVDIGAYEFYDHLVAHWKLNEKGGTMAWDSSGNGHHGTPYGAPNWKPAGGKITGALEFDGVDDYVDCGNDSSFDITEEITLAVWVNTKDAGNLEHNPYVTKGDHSYAIKQHNSNNIEFFIFDSDWHTVWFPVDSSFNGDWHHLAGTYDGNELKLYIDGRLEAATPYVGSIDSSTFNVNIGRNSEITDRFYNGLIDDVRIYNYALSADEVRWLLCDRPPRGDLNRDCRVDFVDFAILASSWLDCGLMVPELCGQ